MMQECPRCKFVQPKDQYCANCGLDIAAYTPAPDPVLKKLGRSASFQMLLVAILVAVGGGLIFYSQKEKLAQHLKNIPQTLSATSEPDSTQARTETSPPTPLTEQELSPPPLDAQANPTADRAATDEDPATATANRQLQVSFVEGSNELFQSLASEGQILNETAQRRSFTIPATITEAQMSERDPDFRALSGGTSHPLKTSTPRSFDFMHISNTTNEDVGLRFEVTPVTHADGSVEVTLLGQLHIKDEAGQTLTNQEINANYVFSARNTLVLVGFLPRQAVRAEDLPSFARGPLAIFESAKFTGGATDFAIIIRAR